MASFAVKAIDHVVLTVKSIPATVEFYTTRLGMKHEVFTSKGIERYVICLFTLTCLGQTYISDVHEFIRDPPRHALVFGNQKLNLHQSGNEFEPKAGKVQPGSEDLCFITDHPVDEVLKSWRSAGIEVRTCFFHWARGHSV